MMSFDVKRKVAKYWDWLQQFGKDSVGPALLMWLLDFRAVRQGTQLAHAYGKQGFDAARKEASQLITRLVGMAIIAALFGIMAQVLGTDSFLGSLPLTLYAIVVSGLFLYAGSVATAAAIVYKAISGESERPASDDDDDDKDIVHNVWDTFMHVLAFNLIFLLLLLFFRPWLPGRTELFLVLVFSEMVWFLFSVRTRDTVRYVSITVCGISGTVTFLVLLYMAASSCSYTEGMAESGRGVAEKLISTVFVSANKVTSISLNAAKGISSLSAEERIVDMNEDDDLDIMDATLIEQTAKDNTAVTWVIIEDKRYPRGDFDGNGVVEEKDAESYRKWKMDMGPGPADLRLRTPRIVGKPKTSSSYRAHNTGYSGGTAGQYATGTPPPASKPAGNRVSLTVGQVLKYPVSPGQKLKIVSDGGSVKHPLGTSSDASGSAPLQNRGGSYPPCHTGEVLVSFDGNKYKMLTWRVENGKQCSYLTIPQQKGITKVQFVIRTPLQGSSGGYELMIS